MNITTNIAKFEDQTSMIIEVLKMHLGAFLVINSLPQEEDVDKWIKFCNGEGEIIALTKRVYLEGGYATLRFNPLDGNIKLQMKQKKGYAIL